MASCWVLQCCWVPEAGAGGRRCGAVARPAQRPLTCKARQEWRLAYRRRRNQQRYHHKQQVRPWQLRLQPTRLTPSGRLTRRSRAWPHRRHVQHLYKMACVRQSGNIAMAHESRPHILAHFLSPTPGIRHRSKALRMARQRRMVVMPLAPLQ